MSADDLTREIWRDADERGKPVSDDRKVWEAVRDELKRTTFPGGTTFEQAMAAIFHISEMVRQWKTTRNPHSIDAALMACHRHGIAPSETMMAEFSAASALRLYGDPTGTGDAVRKGALLEKSLFLMANLLIRDIVTLENAARKAQTWQQRVAPMEPHYKASGLERRYTKRIRKTGLEQNMRDTLPEHTAESEKQWHDLAESLPESPDYLSGFRR